MVIKGDYNEIRVDYSGIYQDKVYSLIFCQIIACLFQSNWAARDRILYSGMRGLRKAQKLQKVTHGFRYVNKLENGFSYVI